MNPRRGGLLPTQKHIGCGATPIRPYIFNDEDRSFLVGVPASAGLQVSESDFKDRLKPGLQPRPIRIFQLESRLQPVRK